MGAWLAYYQKSGALYAEIAEIDLGHHHECLYWAERERESAEEVAARPVLALRDPPELKAAQLGMIEQPLCDHHILAISLHEHHPRSEWVCYSARTPGSGGVLGW